MMKNFNPLGVVDIRQIDRGVFAIDFPDTKLWSSTMKQRHLILSAAVAASLASAPGFLLAATKNLSPAFVNGATPRVTETVSDSQLTIVPKTHLALISSATSTAPLADSAKMSHLQLILNPSALQTAYMETTISSQHDPKSPQFHQWLTPQQFGARFGVADSDIAAVTSWLTSHGFTVNSVYPNKTQIDFSGTVAQIRQTFHTQENVYTIDNVEHVSNSRDISVPTALKEVVAGVMGLNDYHAKALIEKPQLAKWDASKKNFSIKSEAGGTKVKGQAIQINPVTRGLVPNDMATIYGIRTLRNNGVTGSGINIAVVENADMVPSDWTNFVNVFNLGKFNGTFQQINPAAPSGTNNCVDPKADGSNESPETLLDAEWSSAIAPGANIWVASCSDYLSDGTTNATDNAGGGVYLASLNLINATNSTSRPDIISVSYGAGEFFFDKPSKTAIDLMWAQADAEGISVFVATGDAGANANFNGTIIQGAAGNPGIDANGLATSPHVTGVGGNDFSDVLKGTTSQYFAATPSAVGGSALSYVPEITWNQSCGNPVAAVAYGFRDALSYCEFSSKIDQYGYYLTSAGGGGGASTFNTKPAWQRQVFNAAQDQSRDLPDVSLFAGSFGRATFVITCTDYYPCAPGFSSTVKLEAGTSLSSPMFAGIQALIDQGLTRNGLPADQGNAAPTLYALAANEYGTASGPTLGSLAACNADNGTTGSAACVFHNITSGSNSTSCYQYKAAFTTSNCYFYGTIYSGHYQVGLTSILASPTSYAASNAAYSATSGWNFASGLGSVNATNLLIAWRAFLGAVPSKSASPSSK